MSLRPAATVIFTDGLAALHRGQLDLAEEKLTALSAKRHDVLAEATEGHCANGYVRTGDERTLEAMTMELELEGLIALARGESELALAKLGKAAELEEDSPFGFGPPVPPKPAQEILGEALLELGRHGEARVALEAALERAPRRVRSLDALRRAAGGAGDRRWRRGRFRPFVRSPIGRIARSPKRSGRRRRADAQILEPTVRVSGPGSASDTLSCK